MATYNSNGFQIGFERVSNCGDENVFFIHGNLASKEWWYPGMELLGRPDSQGVAIAADWRGYGDSRGVKSVSEIDFFQFAKDFVSLLKNQEMSQVNVVGHSTGGLIAMLCVLEEPDLFKSLTLLDSVGTTGLELTLPKEQVLAHFKKMSEDRDYAFPVLAATIKDVDPQSDMFRKLFEITWKADKVMFQGVIEVLSSQIDIRDRMNAIQLPTLILHGDQDVVLPMTMAEETHRHLPQSQLKVMDGQGHSMNLENPQRMINELQSFWSKL